MKTHAQFLDKPIVNYIKLQLETGSPVRTKRALQHLCNLYRSGFRIRPHEAFGIETTTVGLLYTQRSDGKVCRWALIALALFGREERCVEAILDVLKRYADDPQTTAAAIAAVYRLSRNPTEHLKKHSFDEQMIALAALQHVDATKLDLSPLPLNIDDASPDLLRLALIVVGLDRATINLFNPKHDNAQMVKVLGGHHDSTVSQYSVWAITENPSLGFNDLGIDVRAIEQQPANVRCWLFQLLGMNVKLARRHYEYLNLG